MRQLAFAAALLLSLPCVALAQGSTTMSPASPDAASQMPQPENSLPAGGSTGMTHHRASRHRHHTMHHAHRSHAMRHMAPQSPAL